MQEKAIPLFLLKSNHLLIISPTGTGKTEAVFFPLLNILSKERKESLYAIYVTPLRALNRDIFKRMSLLCERLGVKIRIRHGDTPTSERSSIMRAPPNILVTTPESLDALCVLSSFNRFFKDLRFLILDEVHEILESKRGIHLILTLSRIREFNKNFRIIALSATIRDPLKIAEYIFFDEPFTIVNEESERNAEVKISLIENIQDFSREVRDLSMNYNNMIIFANTRSLAESLASALNQMKDLKVKVHHGSLARVVREEVESKLKEGQLNVVVATSSLEHGIDIPSVDVVLQYGSPMQACIFKQRVGRSAHKLNLKPKGIIFVHNALEILESFIIALNSNSNKLEDYDFSLSLDVLAHHLVGLLLIKEFININVLYESLIKLNLFKNLTKDKLQRLIEYLSKIRLIFVRGDNIYPIRARCIPYYFSTISTIFEEPLYSCIDASSRTVIGKVEGRSLYYAYDENIPLVLAGMPWKVISIDEERLQAELLPLPPSEAEIPMWTGELLPVSREVAEETFARLNQLLKKNDLDELSRGEVYVDVQALNALRSFLNNILLNSPFLPSEKTIIIERFGDIISIINPRGTKINRGIAILLRGLLKGKVLESSYLAYGVVLHLRENISFTTLVNYLLRLPEILLERDLLSEILYEDYSFLSVLKQTAIFMGVFRKEHLKELNRKVLMGLKNTLVEEEAINYFLEQYCASKELINFVNEIGKSVKLLCFEVRYPSPISFMMISNLPLFKDVTDKTSPSILDAIEKRLLEEELLFLCFACKADFKAKIANLEEMPKCKRCNSIKLAAINPFDEEMMKAFEAFKVSNLKLLKKYSNAFERISLSAELVSRYGKIAAMVMAGRGIGPEFARRILTKWKGDKSELIKEILNYEINYARTRRFWSD